jgi:hypothetical protein
MSTTSELLHVDVLVTRLREAFPEQDEHAVHAVVLDALSSLAGARLQQFVPLLAEKRARAACRARRLAGEAADVVHGDVVQSASTP